MVIDDPNVPPIATRLALVKLFLELHLFNPALLVLQGVMSSDDQEVEAWYLEGWCFFMMAEQARENGEKLDDLTWEELAKDSRDCLETCKIVRLLYFAFQIYDISLFQLHVNEGHPDMPLLEHASELINQLDQLGITPSPVDQGVELEWEDADGSDSSDEDVEME